jgi:hypothetical protein
MNIIRTRINYHLGLEKRARRDPKAFARNPQDEATAEVATAALRYAMDRTGYHDERSFAWENIKIEGVGAMEAALEPRQDGGMDVRWRRIPWDRFFFDPHSARMDFSDAAYVGQVRWEDEDTLLGEYPEAEEAITLSSANDSIGLSDTYDDRPRFEVWTDPKRKRLRVVQLWHKQGGEWMYCEFVRGGILAVGPSPFHDDQGDSLCGIVAESCYVDRDNNRYGEVRDRVDPQDEINKRRSKALHLLNTRTIITTTNAAPDGDLEKMRREANRPDGLVVRAPGSEFEIDKNTELAAGQSDLAAQAMGYVASSGPNMALLGKGTESQSGRAIQAQQQGGMIELGDGLDTLRRLDWRVYKQTWNAIREYWQAPMWIRVTDDERAPQYVGINQPQMQMTEFGEQMVGMQNAVAEMDVDILIEDAPDLSSLEGETFAAMMDVLKSGAPPPVMMFIAEMHPGLASSKKRKLQQMIEQMMQMAAQQQQQEQAKEQAKTQGDLAIRKQSADTQSARLELDAMVAGADMAEKAGRPDPQMKGPPAQA